MCEFNRIAFIAESKSTVCSKYSIALCRFNYQIFNSHTAVFDSFLRGAGNITEAPPVADEARRCWRKTRSITPAPRAIGDYVLRGLCGGVQSTPFPRGSQTASTTAARLLEACSSGVIKSLTLLFCVFSQTSQARPRVRLRKSGSGLEAPSAAAGHFLFDVNLVVHQPACSEEQTD